MSSIWRTLRFEGLWLSIGIVLLAVVGTPWGYLFLVMSAGGVIHGLFDRVGLLARAGLTPTRQVILLVSLVFVAVLILCLLALAGAISTRLVGAVGLVLILFSTIGLPRALREHWNS